MASSYYFVINDTMLELTNNNKYLYWSTNDIEDVMIDQYITARDFYYKLFGYSDIVIECLDNNLPRYAKNITKKKSRINAEQLAYIKLSSVNVKELLN